MLIKTTHTPSANRGGQNTRHAMDAEKPAMRKQNFQFYKKKKVFFSFKMTLTASESTDIPPRR